MRSRPTTPPTAAPAMTLVDIALDTLAAAAAISELVVRGADCELEIEESILIDDGVGDGDDVGQPIMEGEVRAHPSMG
jgi:hypothetical protein